MREDELRFKKGCFEARVQWSQRLERKVYVVSDLSSRMVSNHGTRKHTGLKAEKLISGRSTGSTDKRPNLATVGLEA